MKNKIILALLLACSIFTAACKKETEITGEVFVVTKGAGNYKFGLVQVAIVPLEEAKQQVRSQQSAVTRAWEEAIAYESTCDGYERKYSDDDRNYRVEKMLGDCRDLAENAKEAVYSKYFTTLPLPVATAQTDSDGKFNLKLPEGGKYAVAAKAERSVTGERREQYFWLFEINADGTPQKISLSSNNMVSSNYQESLITVSK